MKVNYKDYEIEVYREKCLAGYPLLYYSIFRKDGFECTSGFTDSSDTVRDMIGYLKVRIENELKENDPWMEHSNCVSTLKNLA